jgi:hypothetical protein
MKIVFIAAALVLAAYTNVQAQCNKKVVLTASQTEYLGADLNVQRTVAEQSVVEFDSTGITIVAGDEHKMTGKISSYQCNWTEAFKEGKTVLKTAIADGENTPKNVTISIEGKGGKVYFLAEVDDEPNKKIQLLADKFDEKK